MPGGVHDRSGSARDQQGGSIGGTRSPIQQTEATVTKDFPAEGMANFENSVPFFWPLAPWAELGKEAAETFKKNLDFAREEVKEKFELEPVWATPNEVIYDLNTLRLRDFSDVAARSDSSIIPTVIDPPYAGHNSTIADYAQGQSVVETLRASGIRRLLCLDWKSATEEMKDYNIDIYLAELNAVVDDLGGRINLIGLCQGGWMAAMFAARYPP
jgi:poly(3-hydroxybutyrate) depolymerase